MNYFLVKKLAYKEIDKDFGFGFCYIPDAKTFLYDLIKIIPPSGLDRTIAFGCIRIGEEKAEEFLAMKINILAGKISYQFHVLFPLKGIHLLNTIFSKDDVFLISNKMVWELVTDNTSKNKESLIQLFPKHAFSIKDKLSEAIMIFCKDINNDKIVCSDKFKSIIKEKLCSLQKY